MFWTHADDRLFDRRGKSGKQEQERRKLLRKRKSPLRILSVYGRLRGTENLPRVATADPTVGPDHSFSSGYSGSDVAPDLNRQFRLRIEIHALFELVGCNLKIADTKRQSARQSGVVVVLCVFDGRLLCAWRHRQVWMRIFHICGRSFDSRAGGADSLLDFLFSRCQRIIRDVQRLLLYFDFDYSTQSFDRIGDFLLARGISELINLEPGDHGFVQTRIGVARFIVHVFSKCFVRSAINLCIRHEIVTD
jgi:hypothetical protein